MGAELMSIWSLIGVIGGFTLLLAGWIWQTREKVSGDLESNYKYFNNKIDDLNARIVVLSNQLERQSTMIEPYWEALCEALPGILKMRNSPDIVDYVLNGNPTIKEVDEFASNIKKQLKEAQDTNNDTRAIALSLLVAALKVKRNKLHSMKLTGRR